MKSATMRTWLHRLGPAAKALVAVSLFYWLYRSGRVDLSQFPVFGPRHVVGLALLLASMLIQAVRWWILLRAQGIDIGLGRATSVSWISQFFTQVLPGATGGEIVRAVYAIRDAPGLKLAATSSVVVDRAFGMFAMLVLGVTASGALLMSAIVDATLVERIAVSSAALLIVTSLALATLVYALPWNLARKVLPTRLSDPLSTVLDRYRAHRRDMLVCLGLSLVASILLMAGFACAAWTIDPSVQWRTVFAVAPLVFVVSAVPVAPGGIGVAETASSLLFAPFGVESGGTIMLVVRVWMLLLRLPGGVIYVFAKKRPGVSAADEAGTSHSPPR